jgi:UDP-glucose 4-epimerase
VAARIIDPRPAKPALIIGGGFIGSALARALRRSERPFTLAVRGRPPAGSPCLEYAADLAVASDTAALTDLIRDHGHIVLAAGLGSPATAHGRAAEAVADEVALLDTVITAAAQNPATVLTYLSSGGAVYGNTVALPTPESAPTRPIGAYGLAKLAGEQRVRASHAAHGLRARILRVGNVYGPGQPMTGVQGIVGTAFRAAITGEAMAIVDGGRMIRDFVYIDDVVTAILMTAGLPDSLVVANVGTGAGREVIDIVHAVELLSGADIAKQSIASRPFDVRASILDITALRARIPFEPVALVDGLEAAWACHAAQLPSPERIHA